jgi:hypothetical protein
MTDIETIAAGQGFVKSNACESGEAYLYPVELFLQSELPQAIEEALSPAA